MAYTLVVVESPNKVKKIEGFLGPGYRCVATVGHFRDLPASGVLGIQRSGSEVTPIYEVTDRGKQALARIKSLAKAADTVVLATDPDREGEAIAWHVVECLPKRTRCTRVTFQAITKAAVLAAMRVPRAVDQALVDAQQARRLLDRCVGWFVSPTLKAGVGDARARSAGRVQSAALRIVVDHERTIQAFRPTAYHVLTATLRARSSQVAFTADLHEWQGEEVGTTLSDPAIVEQIARVCAGGLWRVADIARVPKPISSPKPYITSTIQKDASRLFRMRPADTMAALQRLFEGGHITYHRTDSPTLAPEAVEGARTYIREHHPELLPKEPPQHAAKGGAQEAHEAIRPTHWETGPNAITTGDGPLYRLIWTRFIASQMIPGKDILSTLRIAVLPEGSQHPAGFFLAKGTLRSVTGFQFFLELMSPKKPTTADREATGEGEGGTTKDSNQVIPAVADGDPLTCIDLQARHTTTKAPPRLTQASLISVLEKARIGRPSTYATILSTILERDYVTEDAKGHLFATDLGTAVVDFLMQHFADDFMSLTYTKTIEGDLDAIAAGSTPWKRFFIQATDQLLQRSRAAGFSGDPFAPGSGPAQRSA